MSDQRFIDFTSLCDCTRERALGGADSKKDIHIGKDNWKDYLFRIRIVIKRDIISIFVNESAYSDKFMAAIVSSGTG